MDHFQDCISGVKDRSSIMSYEAGEKIWHLFYVMFPWQDMPTLNWNTDETLRYAYHPLSIIKALEKLLDKSIENMIVYVLWDDAVLPTMQISLYDVLNNLIDISSACTTTFIVSIELGFSLEWRIASKYFRIASIEKMNVAKRLQVLLESLTDIKLSSDASYIVGCTKNKFGFAKQIIAWDIISQQVAISDRNNIMQELQLLLPESPTAKVNLIWKGEQNLPVLELDLNALIDNWGKVRAVADAFYIIDHEFKYCIEVCNTAIMIGLRPVRGRKQ